MGADELTNQIPDINMVYRCNLAERLRNRTHLDRVVVLDSFLLGKMAKMSLDFSIQSIIHKKGGVVIWRCSHPRSGYQNGNCSVDLKKQVGVPLKRYERISRFELALNRLATADYSELTSIAFELGYSDQSHFIKESSGICRDVALRFCAQQKCRRRKLILSIHRLSGCRFFTILINQV